MTLSKPNTAIIGHAKASGVRIVTTNGGIDLALIGDSISSGLSPTRPQVRREADTTNVTGSGFGAQIEKMVKGSVAGAIGTRVVPGLRRARSPLRRREARVRVERRAASLRPAKIDGKLLASFSPEDSKRFADAVNARKGGEDM